MSQDHRWDLLAENWNDDLNELETLSEEADQELMIVLSRHVTENESYYEQLGCD
jgi:hypothetical protein